MPSSLAHQLCCRLDKSEVLVELQRRGRDPQPGRPDSVIWLRPRDLPVGRIVPLLVELEGARNYHASKTDVRLFAARHDPSERPTTDTFRYHLDLPTLDWEFIRSLNDDRPEMWYTDTPAPMTVPVDYELFAVPSSTVTGERHTTDANLHRALRELFREAWLRRVTPRGFSSDARIESIGGTELVYWNVHWTLPNAHTGTVSFPFVVSAGPDFETVVREEIEGISLPTMAVIDGSPSAHEETRTHETGVRFPAISPSSVYHPGYGVETDREWKGRQRGISQVNTEEPQSASPVGHHVGGISHE